MGSAHPRPGGMSELPFSNELMTVSLPPAVSGPSGMNAIAHCVEGLYGRDTNPLMSLLAAEGIRTLSRSLPIIVKEPANLDARSDALYGAWLAGVVLGSVGMAVHHNISHVLGGTFGLVPANAHTVILPHAVAFNREAAPEAMRVIANALGAKDAAQAIYDLETQIGAPTSLKQLGMRQEELDKAARLVVEHAYYNPRPVAAPGNSKASRGCLSRKPVDVLNTSGSPHNISQCPSE